MKHLITIFLIISSCNLSMVFAQIAINQDNSLPDSSAILDVKSTTQGVLIPRMTTTQRIAVNNPANGLMVYDSTTTSFWFFTDTVWTEINSGIVRSIQDADNDTKIQVEETSDEDKIRIDLEGSERVVISKSNNGLTQIELPNNDNHMFLGKDAGQAMLSGILVPNFFMGYQAGFSNTDGNGNYFLGNQAGFSNIFGSTNYFLGNKAGYSNISGNDNIFIGNLAGYSNVGALQNVYIGSFAGEFSSDFDAAYNTFIGSYAGQKNISGGANTYIGKDAGRNNTSGRDNTFLGYSAGRNNVSGGGNLFLGYSAGNNESGSNKLYIENSSSPTPLIYGEFDNDLVKIHGTLGIKNAYTFPIVDGSANQVLQTDGAGNTAWITPLPSSDNQVADVFQLTGNNLELSLENDGVATHSIDLSSINSTKTLIADDDDDTKIQVEETTDDDKIRFDLEGQERMVFSKSNNGLTQIDLPNNDNHIFLGKDAGQAMQSGVTAPNVFMGHQAGYSTTTGSQNIFIGDKAGYSNINGDANIFIGKQAGIAGTNGSANTLLGFGAGANVSGDFNVFLGFLAGANELGSNKLYIDNSDSPTPLIYGDFVNDTVKIHGTLGIKNVYTFPNTDGTTGQVLQTDGAGNTAWTTPSANTDNQIADVFELNGNNLELSLENDGVATHSIDLSSINSDNQATDVFQLTGNNLELSLENDGVATHSIDLSSINTDNQATDVFQLTGNNLELSLENDGVATHSIDLSSINTDNQATDVFQLTGNNLELSLENDGVATHSIDLSNINTDNQVADTFQLNGNNLELSLENDGVATHSIDLSNINTDNQVADTFQLNGNNLELSLENDGVATHSIDLSSINSTKTLIADVDGDTKIHVEESADEDKVRIDLAGSERLVIEQNSHGHTLLNLPNNNGNVFFGNEAGLNESGSNKLYIENSNSSTPLIYGEFDNDALTINGTLTATGITHANAGIHFPNSFAPDTSYVGTAGNFISFAHFGASEDFLGYKNNAFYFRDSPNGGDTAQPSVHAAAFTTYSSRRWKHNINDLNNALAVVQQLRGVTYTWNEDHGNFDDFGFIAEEVNEVLPQVAKKGIDGEVEGVDYGRITPYLVEAIKEQQKMIMAQNEKIKSLETQAEKVNELETTLKQFQTQLNALTQPLSNISKK